MHAIALLRQRAGLTLRRCDALSGIDFRRWHLFERGLMPTERELLKVAGVLRIEPGTLRALLVRPRRPEARGPRDDLKKKKRPG
jgi:transcriptional regulator with XRE-family HTH domain